MSAVCREDGCRNAPKRGQELCGACAKRPICIEEGCNNRTVARTNWGSMPDDWEWLAKREISDHHHRCRACYERKYRPELRPRVELPPLSESSCGAHIGTAHLPRGA